MGSSLPPLPSSAQGGSRRAAQDGLAATSAATGSSSRATAACCAAASTGTTSSATTNGTANAATKTGKSHGVPRLAAMVSQHSTALPNRSLVLVKASLPAEHQHCSSSIWLVR